MAPPRAQCVNHIIEAEACGIGIGKHARDEGVQAPIAFAGRVSF